MSRFCNWLQRFNDEAGLPLGCSTHALRKAMSRILPESGATNQQGGTITGHNTDRKFTRSAEKANKSGMADNTTADMEEKFVKNQKENGYKTTS